MKKNNWLRVTLTILLTFIVLAGVAGAGFRMGGMQNANLSRNLDGTSSKIPFFGPMHRFENDFNNQQRRGPQMMQGFGRNRPDHEGFGNGRGGYGSPPLFGLLHLVVLGLILWGGYSLYRRSGWHFVKVNSPAEEQVEAKPAAKKKK